MKNPLPILLAILAFAACKTEKEEQPQTETTQVEETFTPTTPAEKVAAAHGYANWKNVNELRFTFNVDRGDNHMERSWVWKPKTNEVTMMSAQDTVSYNRSDMDSTAVATDRGFINDKFWLLAPYQNVWDEAINITVQDTATAPISKETMKKITVVYDSDKGYTPGDAYDYFVDNDNMVREWIYRRGNVSEYSMVTTWEDYEDINGLKIAKTHNAEGGNTKLYFTGIEVN